MLATEMHEDVTLQHEYESGPQDTREKRLDEPFYQGKKGQPVGLGITMDNDAEWGQTLTEACSFDEWSFRMELNKWSTVFDDDDDADAAKEL